MRAKVFFFVIGVFLHVHESARRRRCGPPSTSTSIDTTTYYEYVQESKREKHTRDFDESRRGKGGLNPTRDERVRRPPVV